MRIIAITAFVGALLALPVSPVAAQQERLALKTGGFLEAGATHHSLSSGFEDWNGQFVRGAAVSGNNTWHGDLWHWNQFGEDGTLAALGNTHIWNPDWHSYASVASSSGGFYLPRLRLDALMSRKLLNDRSLVLTVGAGMVDAKDDHQDHSLFVGATYYATPDWIFDGGVRFNRSNPGSVNSSYQHVGVIYGRDKQQYITARYAWGGEAWQIIGPTTVITDFNSRDASLIWRKWVSPNWGFNLRGERYLNPTYSRTGVDLSLFYQF